MFNIFIILFVFAELSFYLLIAQTGVVEVFNSNLYTLAFLPLGGVLGTYVAGKIALDIHYKAVTFLLLQTVTALLYPDFTSFTLFMLGLAVGGISPLIIHTLKRATSVDLGVALALAYGFGTFMFTSNPLHRGLLGFVLSLCALVGYIFAYNKEISDTTDKKSITFPIYLMSIWVFLDSSLFETLSRDASISIWRDGYSFEIVLFHLAGIAAAMLIQLNDAVKSLFITLLFICAYLFYFLHEPLLLSIVYPFVISYYNVAILQNLIKLRSLKQMAFAMLFIGWIASGAGLFVALQGVLDYVPFMLFIMLISNIIEEFKFNKELYHV